MKYSLKSKISKVSIIGAGIAGISCAVQLKRSGILPVIFDKNNKGGMLRFANLVENYPGFPGGIKGNDLVKKIQKQFKSEKLSIIKKNISSVSFKNNLFKVSDGEKDYYSKYLVIASGSSHIDYDDVVIKPELYRYIFYDIELLSRSKNKHVVIIGGGDLAFDYSLNLGKNNKISVLYRSIVPKCLPLLIKRAEKMNNIHKFNNSILQNIYKRKNKKIGVLFNSCSEQKYIEADYILFSVGRKENLDFLNGGFKKEIKLLNKTGRLYIIGDAANKKYRQAAISAGDGVKAAMKIYEMENTNI